MLAEARIFLAIAATPRLNSSMDTKGIHRRVSSGRSRRRRPAVPTIQK